MTDKRSKDRSSPSAPAGYISSSHERDIGGEPEAGLSEAVEGRCRPLGTGTQAASGESPDPGGCPSNTHPHSSQVALEGFPEYLAAGGIDYYEWAACVMWNPKRFQELAELLESIKQRLQREGEFYEWLEFGDVDPMRVYRRGLNRGKESGQHFEFRIRYRGVLIGIANRPIGTVQNPNLWVQLKGRECLLLGAEGAYEDIKQLIALLGGCIEQEVLTRADLALDIAGLRAETLQQLAKAGQFITRAAEVRPHEDIKNGYQTGLSAGKYPMRLIIYDKVRKHLGKSDRLYVRALVDRRYGGVEPEAATRVEYQASRPWLKKNGVSSPEDFQRLRGSLVHKYTHDFFRLTDRPVDRANKNHSRATPHPVWKGIQGGFAVVHGKPSGKLTPIKRSSVHPRQLILQARGCMRQALLQMKRECPTYHEFADAARTLIVEVARTKQERDDFMRDFRNLATEYGA